MEIKIIKKEEKPLLSREECTAEIHSPTTVSYPELKKAFAEKLKKDEGLIDIKRLDQKFGTRKMNVNFYAYSNKEAFNKLEVRKEKKKKTAEAAK